jgi:hypothetical protein
MNLSVYMEELGLTLFIKVMYLCLSLLKKYTPNKIEFYNYNGERNTKQCSSALSCIIEHNKF